MGAGGMAGRNPLRFGNTIVLMGVLILIAVIAPRSAPAQDQSLYSVSSRNNFLTLARAIRPTFVTVPNVVDLQQFAAEAAIVTAGLVVGTISSEWSFGGPDGIVIRQNPRGDAKVLASSSVDLVVLFFSEP